MKQNNTFDQSYSELLVEYILFLREENTTKDWGHINGWTTPFHYRKWNTIQLNIVVPQDYKEKYSLFSNKNILDAKVSEVDTRNFPLISMVLNWYQGKYLRKHLKSDHGEESFLYDFLMGISYDEAFKHDYNFRFAEHIDDKGYKFLQSSYKKNNTYLFSLVALAGYYFHNDQCKKAEQFCKLGYIQDGNNPRILSLLAVIGTSQGGKTNIQNGEKYMNQVEKLIPDQPWVYAWRGDILNKTGKFFEALQSFHEYEKLTKGKHRTFEPFMRKAESYIGVGDFKKARQEMNKIEDYYFGEGYMFLYNEIERKLECFGY